MEKSNTDKLNEEAMKIIMLAGDARNLMTEAMKEMFAEIEKNLVDEKMKQAYNKIAKAHRIQTEMIQSTIADDDFETTLLFSHAQDTLMTVYSESKMIELMIEMYHRLSDKITNNKE